MDFLDLHLEQFFDPSSDFATDAIVFTMTKSIKYQPPLISLLPTGLAFNASFKSLE